MGAVPLRPHPPCVDGTLRWTASAQFPPRKTQAKPQPPQPMLLGIVSDTHGDMQRTRDAGRMLESLAVAQVLHCGDIGSEEIIPLFAAWPTHFVFGNFDHDRQGLAPGIAGGGEKGRGLVRASV